MNRFAWIPKLGGTELNIGSISLTQLEVEVLASEMTEARMLGFGYERLPIVAEGIKPQFLMEAGGNTYKITEVNEVSSELGEFVVIDLHPYDPRSRVLTPDHFSVRVSLRKGLTVTVWVRVE